MCQYVMVVHAFGGAPHKFWYPWLAKQVAERATIFGKQAHVEVLMMPTPRRPQINAWVDAILQAVQRVLDHGTCQELFLVGHSVGCNAIVRFLSHPKAIMLLAGPLRLGGVVCVAGWFSVDEPWEDIAPWCTEPIRCEQARQVLALGAKPLILILSDDDGYTRDYAQNSTLWAEQLGAATMLLPGRRHFASKRQTVVLDVLCKLMGLCEPDEPNPQGAADVSDG